MIRDRSETNQRVIRDKVQVIRTDQRLIRDCLTSSQAPTVWAEHARRRRDAVAPGWRSCFSACMRVLVVDAGIACVSWLSAAMVGPETVFEYQNSIVAG